MSGSAGETVVVGGGIGGLTAALALARTGRRVRVLEREPEFGEVGAGLQLAANATRILAALDVLDDVVAVGVLPRRLVLADALTGKELTALALGDHPDRYGGPYVVLHRADLLRILLAGCERAGVALQAGAEVTGVRDRGVRVEVECADGRCYDSEAVVCADGLHSRLRRLFIDDEPVCEGYVAYRGAVPTSAVERHADLRDVVAWIGPDLHFVQYPLRQGELYNQVAVFRSATYGTEADDWGTPAELDAVFAVCCDHVRESVPLLGRDNRWPMYDRPPLMTWVKGRVALLGDAAHPMLQYLAQGACQAIEDGYALAQAMRRYATASGAGVPEALLAYQDRRAERAARVQRTARTWGRIWHIDGVGKLLRDELFRMRGPEDHRYADWLYRPTVKEAPGYPG